MLDANTAALDAYMAKQEQYDQLGSAFDKEIEPLIEKIKELAESVRNTAMAYEDGYGIDLSDDAEEALKYAIERS